jgi:WXXGXW repeat (2 copies)
MKRLAVILIVCASFLGYTNSTAQVSVGVSIGVAPPALPVYVQPPCPTEGFIWTPGYWAWGPNGYFWVPGVWVRPAHIGWWWTPGYWGFVGGHYFWHGGYWGPHVGFYGGICYGFGYGGCGYYGGRWAGGVFQYNTAVCNVNNTVIHNTYVDRTVINDRAYNTTAVSNRASFNGQGGITNQPTAAERGYMNEQHIQPTSEQQSHELSASKSRNQLASVNGGHPGTTAKASVGGQRFNSSGHNIQSAHAAAPANNNHMSHANAPQMQPHNAMQNHSLMQSNHPAMQHNSMQNRGGGMQRRMQPGRAPGGGNRNMGGGGRNRGR